jgi:hypothetical protein
MSSAEFRSLNRNRTLAEIRKRAKSRLRTSFWRLKNTISHFLNEAKEKGIFPVISPHLAPILRFSKRYQRSLSILSMPSHAATGDASLSPDATFPGASPLSHAASGDASSNEGLTHSLPHHLFNSGQTFILDDLTTVHTDDTSSNVSNQFLRSELNSISFNFISLFFIFFRETKSIVY